MDSYLTLAAATLALRLPTQVPSYEQCSQLIHIYAYACGSVTWLKYSIDIKLVARNSNLPSHRW